MSEYYEALQNNNSGPSKIHVGNTSLFSVVCGYFCTGIISYIYFLYALAES